MNTHNRRLNFFSIFTIAAMLVALVGFLPASTAAARQACGTTYVVQSGDTIGGIAQQCGTTITAIARANPNISDLSLIYPGQTILLPGAVTIIPNTGQEVYIVKPLDSMSQIAANFGVSLDALIQANPGIANPSLIFSGERILIPTTTPGIPNTGGTPAVQLDQSSGPAGQVVYLTGSNFPANVGVNIDFGQEGTNLASVTAANTGSDGRFTAAITIPSTAVPGTIWVVQASTDVPAGGIVVSTTFEVLSSSLGNVYIVQPGDTLSGIAVTFGTTVNALLTANPGITDPSLIFSGERILIPATNPGIPNTGGTPAVQLNRTSGPAGQVIYVTGSNFPANIGVNIDLGQEGTTLDSVLSVDTGLDGRFTVAVTIPSTAIPGTTWVVQAYSEAAGGIIVNATYDVLSSPTGNVYIVRPGDTFAGIAARFGVTKNALLNANPSITDPNLIYSGEQIVIP